MLKQQSISVKSLRRTCDILVELEDRTLTVVCVLQGKGLLNETDRRFLVESVKHTVNSDDLLK